MANMLIKTLLGASALGLVAYAFMPKDAHAAAASPSPLPPATKPPVKPPVAVPNLASVADAAMQNLYKQAMTSKDPAFVSSIAFQLDVAGYTAQAAACRDRAKNLSQALPVPTAAQQISNVQPGMPAAMSAEVTRILRDSSDPKVLDALAAVCRQNGWNAAADQLTAKANEVRAALAAAQGVQQVQTILDTLPGGAATAPKPPTAQTVVLSPTTITAKTPAEAAAGDMVRNLNSAVAKYKTVKLAKGHEDKNAVKKFQQASGLKQDGLVGPGVLVEAAKYIGVLPPVFYWPKSATAANVLAYRASLNKIADDIDNRTPTGDPMRAVALRASAAREHGEAGIVGKMPA